MRSLKELAAATDPDLLRAIGSLRRMAITLTTKVLWQLAGFRQPDGKPETNNAEPFTGIGFTARPSSSGKPEAIVAMIADADAPAIIGTRDEKTRAASAGDLAEDETAVFNTVARLVVRRGGTIELGRVVGAAVESMIKGQTYRTAEDTLFSAMSAFAVAIVAYANAIQGTADPTHAATTAIGTAATAFETAIAAFQSAGATYLSQVGKVG